MVNEQLNSLLFQTYKDVCEEFVESRDPSLIPTITEGARLIGQYVLDEYKEWQIENWPSSLPR